MRSKPQKLVVECVGGTGLIDSEVELLSAKLEKLDLIIASAARLGGAEAASVRSLCDRVRNRLAPEKSEDLAVAAQKLITTFLPTIEQGRAKALAHEAETAAIQAELHAEVEARATTMAAAIEAAEEKRREALRAVQDEIRRSAKAAVDEVVPS